MTTKMVATCKRKAGWSEEDFRAEHVKHVEMARQFEMIREYTYSFSMPGLDGSEPPFDLLVEFWVDDLDAYWARMASPEGQEALAHAQSYTTDLRLTMVEEHRGW